MKGKAESFEFEGETYAVKKIDKLTSAIFGSGTSVECFAEVPEGFEEAASEAIGAEADAFECGGTQYYLLSEKEHTGIYSVQEDLPAMFFSTLVFNAYNAGTGFDDDFKAKTFYHAVYGGDFEYDGRTCEVREDNGELTVCSDDEEIAMLSSFVVRDAKGNDTFDLAFKETVQEVIMRMQSEGLKKYSFSYNLPKRVTEIDENGSEC